MRGKPWHGVDLDGTLAEYHGWQGPQHIGAPIPAMLARVKAWLDAGEDVRILTARAAHQEPEVVTAIEAWCKLHLGVVLRVTCSKDFDMIDLWDDRAIQIVSNTGRRADGKP